MNLLPTPTSFLRVTVAGRGAGKELNGKSTMDRGGYDGSGKYMYGSIVVELKEASCMPFATMYLTVVFSRGKPLLWLPGLYVRDKASTRRTFVDLIPYAAGAGTAECSK